ncbi:MAG: MFS transporter [Deltaproteobacteria bacterium]|nr:MAG: MFS transporter [Deltaproteobacteria bacterium]
MPAEILRPRPGLLARLGLGTPALRAWALYDCANSAAVTSILTAIFPIYFVSVVAADLPPALATQRYAVATTASLVLVAVLSPFVGAIADVRPVKKRMLASFMALGVFASASLFFVSRGDSLLGTALLVLVNVGLNGSFVFYDALLPHVAREDELDRVSAAGYAIGYLGGGLLLAVQLVLILYPGLLGLPAGAAATPAQATFPARLAFLTTAIWWAVFTIPLLRRVPEPRIAAEAHGGAPLTFRAALTRLGSTFRTLSRHRQATRMLIAFLLYNDGIGTIIRMATAFGTEIGLGSGALIAAILLVQFVGIPFSFLFGSIAEKIGTKRTVLAGLAVYTGIAVLAYFTRTEAHFFALAFLVATVQGGTQALSRSLFAALVPRYLSGEFFAFFGVSEKFAGIFGPAVFATTIAVTGSSRTAVLSVIAFFAVGALILLGVDVEAGQREARAADAVAGAPARTTTP